MKNIIKNKNMISTENLYICELFLVLKNNYKEISVKTAKRYILAHKLMGENNIKKYIYSYAKRAAINNEIYIDAVTKTVFLPYSMDSSAPISVGSLIVKDTQPIITDMKYITIEQAAEALKRMNPTFFELKVETEKPKVKKRLFKK